MKIKMYCIFAMESLKKMNGNRGKLAAMSGHAYLHSFWDAMSDMASDGNRPKFSQAMQYQLSNHAYKIALVVDTVAELELLKAKYADRCGTSLVKDAGFTVFKEPTVICLGIGPIADDQVGDDIEQLNLFL